MFVSLPASPTIVFTAPEVSDAVVFCEEPDETSETEVWIGEATPKRQSWHSAPPTDRQARFCSWMVGIRPRRMANPGNLQRSLVAKGRAVEARVIPSLISYARLFGGPRRLRPGLAQSGTNVLPQLARLSLNLSTAVRRGCFLARHGFFMGCELQFGVQFPVTTPNFKTTSP